MNKKQEKHTSRGINLIALVITITVILILAVVTITITVNKGARVTTGDTKNAIEEENSLLTEGVKEEGRKQESILAYNETKTNSDGTLKSNAKYESDGKTAIIPKGFKIIADAEGKKSIDAGLVIQDSEGNEFVWVPVTVEGTTNAKKEANFEKIRTDGYYIDFLQTWVSDKEVTEPSEYGYKDGKGTEETKDYKEMRTSVIKNGGFYIGRYEAGIDGQTPRTYTDNGTSKMVVQRDKFPYNFVGWGSDISDYEADTIWKDKNQGKGALYLSKHMYDGKDIGATSTLCYGIQWDMALAFIGDENYNKNSTTKGNYSTNIWTIDRETAKYTKSPSGDTTWTSISSEENKTKSKTVMENILLTTGASEDFKTKNIYDLAGNVYEWTNEAFLETDRVYRGGYYGDLGFKYPASYRYGAYTDYCGDNVGFRPALYIK